MTAKEYVQSYLPKARAERQVSGRIKGMQTVYWLIRDGRETLYIESGNTESNAWVNAKKWVMENQDEILRKQKQTNV